MVLVDKDLPKWIIDIIKKSKNNISLIGNTSQEGLIGGDYLVVFCDESSIWDFDKRISNNKGISYFIIGDTADEVFFEKISASDIHCYHYIYTSFENLNIN